MTTEPPVPASDSLGVQRRADSFLVLHPSLLALPWSQLTGPRHFRAGFRSCGLCAAYCTLTSFAFSLYFSMVEAVEAAVDLLPTLFHRTNLQGIPNQGD
jgi:hypothetical protein